MIKQLLTVATLVVSFSATATVHMVTRTGFTFTPDTVHAIVGDTVHWDLPSAHNVTEVSQSTWNANGNTPSGGFFYNGIAVSTGTANFVTTTAGTHWYVCSPHASMGMKGVIIVSPNSAGVEDRQDIAFDVYPTPAREMVFVQLEDNREASEISLFGVDGKVVQNIQVAANTAVVEISLAHLPKGVYFIRVRQGRLSSTARVIKE
jgi:plastocyanin